MGLLELRLYSMYVECFERIDCSQAIDTRCRRAPLAEVQSLMTGALPGRIWWAPQSDEIPISSESTLPARRANLPCLVDHLGCPVYPTISSKE